MGEGYSAVSLMAVELWDSFKLSPIYIDRERAIYRLDDRVIEYVLQHRDVLDLCIGRNVVLVECV